MTRRETHWRPWLWLSALIAASLLVVATVGIPGHLHSTVGPILLVCAGVAALASWLSYQGGRQRAAHKRELQQAARSEALLRDRVTIAAELHDLLSHGLGAITLRARAGQRAATLDDARLALADITGLSRQATDELRQVLAVLKDPGSAAPLEPTAGLAQIPSLIEGARAQGIIVDASGLDCSCSPAAGLAAHHVVREGLLNVSRHAGPTTASVRLERPARDLVVTVTNAGTQRHEPAPGSGHGLALLERQVRSAGGTLTAGPIPDGFELSATIPDPGGRQ